MKNEKQRGPEQKLLANLGETKENMSKMFSDISTRYSHGNVASNASGKQDVGLGMIKESASIRESARYLATAILDLKDVAPENLAQLQKAVNLLKVRVKNTTITDLQLEKTGLAKFYLKERTKLDNSRVVSFSEVGEALLKSVEEVQHVDYGNPDKSDSLFSQIIYLVVLVESLVREISKNRSKRVKSIFLKNEELLSDLTNYAVDLLLNKYITQQHEAQNIVRDGVFRRMLNVIESGKVLFFGKKNLSLELNLISESSMNISNDLKDDFVSEEQKLSRVGERLLKNRLQRIVVKKALTSENCSNIEKNYGAIGWDDINLSKGVSSFEYRLAGSPNLIVFVDPAPAKSYVARIALIPEDLYLETIKDLDLDPDKKNEVSALKFYLTSEGKLCVYGNSEEGLKVLLNNPEYHKSLEQLSYGLIYKTSSVKYVNKKGDDGAHDFPKEKKGRSKKLPEEPTKRVKSHSGESELRGKIDSRISHNRCLPYGYRPGVSAFKKMKADDGVSLYAVFYKRSDSDPNIDDEVLENREPILLDKIASYGEFIGQIEHLSAEHNKDGQYLRFQTYVREVKTED